MQCKDISLILTCINFVGKKNFPQKKNFIKKKINFVNIKKEKKKKTFFFLQKNLETNEQQKKF